MANRLKRLLSLSPLANHYPALHGLRVLAIVLVVQVHLTVAVRNLEIAGQGAFFFRSRSLSFGMDLFFILSGFLIGSILLHSMEDGRRHSIPRFYLRRCLRIFPLYYVVLTVFALTLPMTALKQSHLIYDYLYLTNYTGPVRSMSVMPWNWSLCVEEHFYLLVPVLILGLRLLRSHRARLSLLGALWLGGTSIRLATFLMADEPWTNRRLQIELMCPSHQRVDILVAGVALAYVQHHFQPWLRQQLGRGAVRAGLWSLVLVALFLLLFPRVIGDRFLHSVLKWGTLTSLMYVPLILLVINREGRFTRFLSAPAFRKVATLGYGIYLVHFPVGVVLCHKLRSYLSTEDGFAVAAWFAILAAQLLVSGVIAYLLHLIIEKPVLALRERLSP